MFQLVFTCTYKRMNFSSSRHAHHYTTPICCTDVNVKKWLRYSTSFICAPSHETHTSDTFNILFTNNFKRTSRKTCEKSIEKPRLYAFVV